MALDPVEHEQIQVACVFSDEVMVQRVLKHRVARLRNERVADGDPLGTVRRSDAANGVVPIAQEFQFFDYDGLQKHVSFQDRLREYLVERGIVRRGLREPATHAASRDWRDRRGTAYQGRGLKKRTS